MNYEKLYKEALERASKYYNANTNKGYREIFEDIFHEFKESEDERIRKAIICGMNALKEQHKETFASIPINDCLAWLEKQSGKVDVLDDFPTEFERQISHLIASSINKEWDYTESFVKYTANALLQYAKNELEKQGEQKPADKVEPKFKAGDWIIGNTNNIYTVICVIDDEYRLLYNIDDSIVCAKIKTIDKKFHLWTIQDAKDGDVLYHKSPLTGIEYIVMGRGVNGYGAIDSYFRYNSEDGFDTNIPSVFSAKNDITPATKEQCDLLFQKMKEEGYEWDAEKKELKKIEQKHSWSEEDEEMKLDTIKAFQLAYPYATEEENPRKRNIEWLKSLKPQSRWKPTEEQMEALTIAVHDSHEHRYYKNLYSLYNDLKSLQS